MKTSKRRVVSMMCGLLAVLAGGCSSAPGERADGGRADVRLADFDGATYGDWTATGRAFASGPARGDTLRVLEIDGVDGSGAATTEYEGDGSVGRLTSPAFRIEREYIAFRIGGGDYERHTCINLVVDGRIVRSATGWNSDRLAPTAWDVREFAGRMGAIEIVDEARGDWGHLNVDRIVQTDRPETLPVPKAELYTETLRPQFHFTARQWTMDRLNPGMRQEGWINDLNGLIEIDGEYHLFAQRWAKCWLHAVSTDLVHWTELEPAFWEEELDSGVQSGTCVYDLRNTSGLSPDPKNPPLIAFWSRFDNRSQCLSYSLDKGRTWTPHPKNPLFVRPERDPKVFWHEPTQRWVMMLYGDQKYDILTSTNLLDWRDEKSSLKDCFECPDFFELALDGDPAKKKWVLIQGDGRYSIGTFDGRAFTEETPRRACDIGPHFYATQSWSHARETGKPRVQAAWMRGGSYPGMPFNQQVSFPCELTLRSTKDGPRLYRNPVKTIEGLQRSASTWSARTLNAGATLPLAPAGDLYRLVAEVEIGEKATLVVNLRGEQVTFTRSSIKSGEASGETLKPITSIEILLDRASIETFVNGGELSSTRCILPRGTGLSLKAEHGPVTIKSLTLSPLNSAWKAGGR